MKSWFAVVVVMATCCLWAPPSMAWEQNVDRPGMDYRNFDLNVADPGLCEKACMDDEKCKAYTYVKPGVQGPKARCWLKHSVPQARGNDCCVSGVKQAPAAQPLLQGQPELHTTQAKPMASGQSPQMTVVEPHVVHPKALERQKKLRDFDATWKKELATRLKDLNARLQKQMDDMRQQAANTMKKNQDVLDSVDPARGLCITPEGIVEPCPPPMGQPMEPKPVVNGYIATAHGIGKGLEPGDEVLILGDNFGDEQGHISFNQKVDLYFVKYPLPFTVVRWTNGGIRLKIADKVPGLIRPENLLLLISQKDGRSGDYTGVTLFPHLHFMVISGKAYFKGDWDGEKGEAVETADNFLKVSHDPECSWHDWAGNEGTDWVFKTYPLPDYITLVEPIFHVIPPDMPDSAWEYFVEGVEELAEYLWDVYNGDWTGIFSHWWDLGAPFFFDKAGSYVCRVEKEPNKNDRSMSIHWENSCTGHFDSLPVEYMMSFVVAYPDGYPPPRQ